MTTQASSASPLDIPVMPLPEDLRTALALYEAPFKYARGYILDAKNNMVADDDGQDVALRVRGWGRISYMQEPETLQDAVGCLIAQALTEFWARHNVEVRGEGKRSLTESSAEGATSTAWLDGE